MTSRTPLSDEEEADNFDAAILRDIEAGKLDKLADEALAEHQARNSQAL